MKKVLDKYREFARYIDKDIKIKKGYTSWATIPLYKQIEIPQVATFESEQLFLQDIKKRLPQGKKFLIDMLPNYTWSFLHEVGHIQCNHIQEDTIIRVIADFLGSLGLTKIANLIYFKLKEERQATDWAISYVLNNFDTVVKFTTELEKTYKRYYKTLGIVE